MNKFHKLAAITALSLTAALTYTCSSGGGGNDDPPPSSSSVGASSSGGGSSSGGSSSSVAEAPKCGGEEYDTSAKGCCNANLFTLATQRCENNVIETKCGSAWYNTADASLRCESNIVETKCGTYWYNAANTKLRCEDDVVAVTIGEQVWMAQNLNTNVEGSVCYDDDQANCDKYGRLYNWDTAMDGAAGSATNPSGVQGVCPSGWHLPSGAEWNALVAYIGGRTGGGTKLKSASSWNSNEGTPVGTDEYGFAALPSGYSNENGIGFIDVGDRTRWWVTDEHVSDGLIVDGVYTNAFFCSLSYNSEYAGDFNSVSTNKTRLVSVRCVKD